MREIKYIIWHCTAGPQTQTVDIIKAYWKNVLGWKTPGYHHMVRPDGTVADLVPIENISNGVAGYNANSINISYIGGVEVIKGKSAKGVPINILGKSIDNRTPMQKQSMYELAKKYSEMFPNAIHKGHRDFSPDKNRDGIIQPSEWMKTCPSFSVSEWLKCVGLN